MRADRRRVPVAIVASSLACLTALALAGCSGASHSAQGVTAKPQAAGSMSAPASPGSTSAGSANNNGGNNNGNGNGGNGNGGNGATATAGGTSSASSSYLKGCDAKAFATHAGLATGAVHEYVTKPYTTGRLTASQQQTLARAQLATAYARTQLALAVTAMKPCPTARALVGVTGQNITFLEILGSRLKSPTLPDTMLRAADPLLADVASQAGRINVTLVPVVPTATQLHG